MALEYSLKMQRESVKIAKEHNDNTPLVIPSDCTQPETYNEAIARILRHSGVIDDGAYEKLRGVSYDGDFNDESEDFDGDFDDDDDFEQSSFASYLDEDFRKSVAPTETPPPDPAPVAEQQAEQSGQALPSDSGNESSAQKE
ncbi:MAG: hypothetical protein [Microviridae sp.]|nr:MAG: hypothetical protein [Microviridae sp.]